MYGMHASPRHSPYSLHSAYVCRAQRSVLSVSMHGSHSTHLMLSVPDIHAYDMVV